MTYGQLSLAGRGLQWLTRKVGSTFGVEDIEDLASDRLFRFLQYYTVERLRYLSISGSAVNRYSTVCHDDLNEMPYVRALGVRMDRPNDLLVEDSSVDLCRSPLPSEIADLPSQYQHIRAYLDCTSVSHTGIHASEEVRRILRAYIRQWGAPPQAVRPEPLLTNG